MDLWRRVWNSRRWRRSGRLLNDDDEAVALISHGFWKSRFNGDASAIGRWGTWRGRQFQIAGVAQEGFSGADPGTAIDIWLPLKSFGTAKQMADPEWEAVNVMGRLTSGVTSAPVQPMLQAGFVNNRRLKLRPAAHGHASFIAWQFARPLWFLAAVVGLVLLITCSNLANLLAARTAARAREMAMRAAIGAGRGRLIQQVLIQTPCLRERPV